MLVQHLDSTKYISASHSPTQVQQSSSKLLFAADQLTEGSMLRKLYEWPPMLHFVRAALEQPQLHLSSDPMGRYYLNIFGQGHSW